LKRKFNYKKANWEKYRETIDKEIQNLEPTPENYEIFANKVKKYLDITYHAAAEKSTYQARPK